MKKIVITAATLLAFGVAPLLASAQSITSISPSTISAGSSDTQITVNGSGFNSGAKVNVNGTAVNTNYVSSSQLKATVPSSNLTTAGSLSVTVTNPGQSPSSPSTLTVTSSNTNTGNNTGTTGTVTPGLPNTGFGPEANTSAFNFGALLAAIASAAAVLFAAAYTKRRLS